MRLQDPGSIPGVSTKEVHMKILLVDDDTFIISVVECLKILHKCQVVRVFNGQQALDRLATGEHFDCIMLDERMPVMTGEEFLLKYDGKVPIIYTTAYSDRTPIRPVAAIVLKPYDAGDIAEEARRICGVQ